jgi:predicted glycoside hydrolase/deacetylase ChbG (UPF0249 family)
MDVPQVNATQLIVNADDFGYFEGVSRGIIDAAEQRVVTATGVMANGPVLHRWIHRLQAIPTLSVGVHLNATLGRPITAQMHQALAANHGEFPSAGTLAKSVLLGRLPVSTLITEWRAQIQHCLDAGLTLSFVNSHEHVHMLPALYSRVRALAAEFGIRHVRAPSPEWGHATTSGGWLRNSVFAISQGCAALLARSNEPRLIGLAPSGRLDTAYCRWRLSRLTKGGRYELMCHPGWNDAEARQNPKLGAYHDWEGELSALSSDDFTRLLRENQIVLTSYERLP